MSKLNLRLTWTIVLSVLAFSILFGGGYQLNEHGARATGMGGAFVARASDPSAIYFNPAGLTQLQGINVLGGTSIILPSTTFRGPVPSQTETSTESQVFTPINLYGTYQINDQIVVGLGVFNPYGLGTKWPVNWVGSQHAIESEIVTFNFNPSVAYKINDDLSVGLGLSLIYGSVAMKQRTATGGIMSLEGTGSGFGFNFGAIYKPIEKLSLGVSFRSLTEIEFSGDAKFTEMGALQPYFPGGTGKAKLPMPMNVFMGAAYELMPELTVEADLQYVGWDAYNKLTINLPLGPVFPGTGTRLQAPVTQIKKWSVGYTGRVGAEYKLDDQICLRGGVIYDITPQPRSKTEPMLPDADRINISIGGSYKINENLSVDAAYMLVNFTEKDATNSALRGYYNSTAHVLCVNVGYAF